MPISRKNLALRRLGSRKNYKQRGGKTDKYILLSCPEFNHVVDNMLMNDNGLTLHGKAVGPVNELDSNFASIDDAKFTRFLSEVYGPFEKSADADKYKTDANRKLYLRDSNDFESAKFYRGFINWKTYNDMAPDIKMNSKTTTKLRGAKIVYLAYFTFNEPAATPMINQLLFLNALNHYGVAEINIVLPYFPVGTMERIVGEGEIPTAYGLAHLLNSIPEGTTKNNLYMFDIHALCSRFFFHTNARPILVTMMAEYLDYINTEFSETGTDNHNIIVFPDDGAKKRFGSLLPKGTKTIVCQKTRKGDVRIVKIESGMENIIQGGRIIDKQINLFVIDDLVQSGGTLLETFDGIKKQLQDVDGYNSDRIKNVSIVTHSVFPKADNLSNYFKARGPEKADISKLITTNSRPLMADKLEADYNDKVAVLDISKALTKIFQNIEDDTYIMPYSIH
jgi:phosphoribosylpyrophosphate synthetase